MKIRYAGLIFCIYFLPFFLLGENAYVQIHDNLENELVYIVNLINSGKWLDWSKESILPNVMEGIPRSAFRSGINGTFCLFAVFPPFWAYVFNKVLVHFIGGWGMWMLLKNHLLPQKRYNGYLILLSLSYALIPYASIFCGIAISGQPLLLSSFLSVLKRQQKWYNVLIILLFPFFISTLLIAPFISIVYLILYASYRYYFGSSNPRFLLLLGLFLAICGVIEYPLLRLSLFDTDFLSHRKEINRINQFYLIQEGRTSSTLLAAGWDFVKVVVHGKWHSGNFINLPIWLLAWWTYWVNRSSRKAILLCIAAIVGTVAYSNFSNSLYRLISPHLLSFLNLYSAERLYFFQPMLMFILLALAIRYLIYKKNKAVIHFCLSLQLILIITASLYPKSNIELKNNLLLLCGWKKQLDEPTFKEFFDTRLYEEAMRFIGKPSSDYRIVNVDLPPSAAQYNGFYALDSYQNNYDLRYKHKFRKVIRKELGKELTLKNYFDENGSRCYLFSCETLGRLIGKKENVQIRHAEWDMVQLQSMGCQYILSAVPILNSGELNLRLQKTFQHNDSYWKIHLYQLGN